MALKCLPQALKEPHQLRMYRSLVSVKCLVVSLIVYVVDILVLLQGDEKEYIGRTNRDGPPAPYKAVCNMLFYFV